MEDICSHDSDEEEEFEDVDVDYDGVAMCEDDCLDDYIDKEYEDE